MAISLGRIWAIAGIVAIGVLHAVDHARVPLRSLSDTCDAWPAAQDVVAPCVVQDDILEFDGLDELNLLQVQLDFQKQAPLVGGVLKPGVLDKLRDDVSSVHTHVIEDRCKCLNWHDVYATKGVSCGSGNEIVVAEPGGGPDHAHLEAFRPTKEQQFCTSFYKALNSSECTNINIQGNATGWQAGTWCYVSSRCGSLGYGAEVPNTSVSWKTCGVKDAHFRNRSVEGLHDFARNYDLQLSLLFKMAYPSLVHRRTLEITDMIDIQQALPDKSPLNFEKQGTHHRPPFRVVSGNEVWIVNYAPDDKVEVDHPYSYTNLTCVVGTACDVQMKLTIGAIRAF